ncbi:MAG: hypothetical protein WA875_11620, partial [Candidatus Acidiferrales bacterium]
MPANVKTAAAEIEMMPSIRKIYGGLKSELKSGNNNISFLDAWRSSNAAALNSANTKVGQQLHTRHPAWEAGVAVTLLDRQPFAG